MRATREILEKSHATAPFKEAVKKLESGEAQSLIEYPDHLPRIKVLRAVKKLLDTYEGEEIERVEIEGYSGCSNFRGKLVYHAPAPVEIKFNWDCAWRAMKEGYRRPFGGVDQVKAARVFDYECFKEFTPVSEPQ